MGKIMSKTRPSEVGKDQCEENVIAGTHIVSSDSENVIAGTHIVCSDSFTPMNEVAMENILLYLETNDLVSLCKTSKEMRGDVQQFALHYVKSTSRAKSVQTFMSCGLLTPDEEALKVRLIEYNEEPNLLESLFFHKLVKLFGRVRRYRILDKSGDLPQYEGSRYDDYWVRKRSTLLQRETLHLKTVCWIHFCPASMPNIPPASYQVSVHIIFGADFYWPCIRDDAVHRSRPDIATHLKVYNKNEADPPLVEVIIEPEYWEMMRRGTFNQSLLKGNAVVTQNGIYGHLIKLKPFVINDETDLVVDWMDHRNAWWKRDLSWDYVQLEEV